jgi:hypothetical protein
VPSLSNLPFREHLSGVQSNHLPIINTRQQRSRVDCWRLSPFFSPTTCSVPTLPLNDTLPCLGCTLSEPRSDLAPAAWFSHPSARVQLSFLMRVSLTYCPSPFFFGSSSSVPPSSSSVPPFPPPLIRKRDVLLWRAYHDLMSLLSTIKPDFAKPGCAWVKSTLPMNLT